MADFGNHSGHSSHCRGVGRGSSSMIETRCMKDAQGSWRAAVTEWADTSHSHKNKNDVIYSLALVGLAILAMLCELKTVLNDSKC